MLTLGDDTFCAVADADAYMAGTMTGSSWPGGTDDATTALKERALRTATRVLDRLPWLGSTMTSTQPLSWPRRYLCDANGRAVPADMLPPAITQATAELALALLQNDLTSDQTIRDLQGVKTKRIGDLSITYGLQQRDPLPAIVRDLIRPFTESSRYSAVLAL
jgi:hypothetical protein